MTNALNRFKTTIYSHLPRVALFYRLATIYKAYYDGMLGWNMESNGELDFMKFFLTRFPNATVFDVGANQGKWSLLALQISAGLKLHAFEPTPATFEKLTKNLERYSPQLNQVALGRQPGQMELLIYKGTTRNSFYQWDDEKPSGAVQVEVDTLDKYCERQGIERIDFLKVDVEGHEIETLSGAQRLLADGKIGVIQFEYGPNWISSRQYLRNLFELIRPYPYTMYKLMPRHIRQVKTYHTKWENFQTTYWLIVSDAMQSQIRDYIRT